MTQKAHYVLIDCDRVQDYVFASVRLREICNASLLLDRLEVGMLPEIVISLTGTTIRSGGGVVLAKFDEKGQAECFIRSARSLYRDYGISATFSDSLSVSLPIRNFYDDVLRPLHTKVRSQKDSPEGQKLHVSTLLAVPCESSGVGPAQRPVEVPGSRIRRMSYSEVKKRSHQRDAIEEAQLSQQFGLRLPHDFGGVVGWTAQEDLQEKDLPGTSEKRLLGIVYADVNGLGKQIPSIAKDETTYATFAKGLQDAVKESLQEALEQVLSPAVAQKYPSSKPRPSNAALPVKVLYVGGDDLAVAVQGCYALDLAGKLLELFEGKSANLLKPLANDPPIPSRSSHLTMSAGVVLAPYNYPIQNFNRVGHELEARAKRFGRRANSSPSPSLVDFCLIKNNASGNLQQVRQWQRIDNDFLLYGGPYKLDELGKLKQAANNLKAANFPHNKLKRLREILSNDQQTAKLLYIEWWNGLNDKHKSAFIDAACKPSNFNLDRPPSLPYQDKGWWVTPVIDLVELSDLW